jgi:hypothetical protein
LLLCSGLCASGPCLENSEVGLAVIEAIVERELAGWVRGWERLSAIAPTDLFSA